MLRDQRGNTLALVAGALLPLIAIIGGAVDISRQYMVKTRLQQACDAGVLAGRKAVGTGTYDAAAKAQATRFFNANFPAGYQDGSALSFTSSSSDNGTTVDGAASVRLPNVLMYIFGFDNANLSVTCTAALEVANADITMVIDTTGSMDDPISDGKGGNQKKIIALRQAMKNFYDAMEEASKGTNSRTRYAFVPYTQAVNIGKILYATNLNWMDFTQSYQSREPNWKYDNRGRRDFDGWTYRKIAFDGSDYPNLKDYIAGRDFVTPTGNNGSDQTSRWDGCVEERDSVNSGNVRFVNGSISPSGMKDLDIDGVPSGSEDGWRPYFPDITYYRTVTYNRTVYYTTASRSDDGGKAPTSCPQQAQLLQPMSRGEFNSYTNSLNAQGGTYHDIGAIWGARVSSPTGPFAANVNQAPANGLFVARHMIFMTDGAMAPGIAYESAYGMELYDRRVTSDGQSDQTGRHTMRFRAICDAAKSKGVRIWVIAFSTALTDDLKYCASTNSAFTSTNSKELNDNFVEIAQSISDLRLTK